MKRTWSVSWDSAASDGTQWHAGLRSGQLEGHKARSLADLSLHRHDISFCDRLLKEYAPSFRGDYDDLSRALWVAVLTKFVGCFRDSAARSLLREKKVYASELQGVAGF